MHLTQSGDLARSFGLNQAYAKKKMRLDVLTREVSSGQKSDVAGSLRGDTRPLACIENTLRRLEAFERNTAEAGTRLAAGQQALGNMRKIIEGMGAAMLSAPLTGASTSALILGADEKLEAAISLLNTQSAGQFLFSGERSAQPAVVGKGALLAQIEAVTSRLKTSDEITAAVSAYFDALAGGGGYLDSAVTGGTRGTGALPIAPGDTMKNSLTAADPAFRNLLKGLTLSVVAQRNLSGNVEEQGRLIKAAGAAVVRADEALISVQASQGVLEERVEIAETRNAAERATLMMARNAIRSADPYETSTALTDIQAQIETLYSITARLSRMSLADRL